MSPELQSLIESILDWWTIHEFDTCKGGDNDDYNVYDSKPHFVELAERLNSGKSTSSINPEEGDTVTILAKAIVLHKSTGHGLCYEVELPKRDFNHDRIVYVDRNEIISHQ